MDHITRKFIHYQDRSFMGKDGQLVDYHQIMLENPDASTDKRYAITFLTISGDLVKKLDLSNPKMIDSLRGKSIDIEGTLYNREDDLKFFVKSIALSQK